MSIGAGEVLFLILIFLGIILVSRIITNVRIKRICPKCGFALRSNVTSCSSCGHNF